jgi:hypothetical protein
MSLVVRLWVLIAGLLMPQPAPAQPVLDITIVRTWENGSSTTGELFMDSRFVAHTLELPWRDNQSYSVSSARLRSQLSSAVPAGALALGVRS